MSQQFTFPPPPPPPPSRPAQSSLPQQNQRGTSRGRGNHHGYQSNGRGRGQTFSRGGYSQPRVGQQYRSPQVEYSEGQGLPQKRPHSNAFRGTTDHHLRQSRPRAPLAVPSFGPDINSLLSVSPQTSKPVEEPRKGNLLGLTPTAAEDSEPENDEDDESRLAAAFADPSLLQFEFKGHTSTLNTPGEIAAWIAERRKKWPTQEKRDIARKEAEQQRAKRELEREARLAEARAKLRVREQERQKRELEKEKSLVRQKILREHLLKAKDASHQMEAITSSQQKIERLKKRAEKVARQLQQAQKALPNALPGQTNDLEQLLAQVEEAAAAQDLASSASDLANIDLSDISSMDNDVEDTSSSGSDSESDSDSAPETMSSKSPRPIRVPPSSTDKLDDNRLPCRSFSATGFCKYGRRCRFKHEKPAKQHVSKPGDRRKGLYQVLVEKEQEEERKRALNTIMALGDAGLLDEPPGHYQTEA